MIVQVQQRRRGAVVERRAEQRRHVGGPDRVQGAQAIGARGRDGRRGAGHQHASAWHAVGPGDERVCGGGRWRWVAVASVVEQHHCAHAAKDQPARHVDARADRGHRYHQIALRKTGGDPRCAPCDRGHPRLAVPGRAQQRDGFGRGVPQLAHDTSTAPGPEAAST